MAEKMIWEVIDSYKKVRSANKVQDDDFSDRVNRRYTVILLVAITVVVGSVQFVGKKPIACWTPAQFTSAMVEYSHSICWISTKYYVPSNKTYHDSAKQKITYYQWVPFILMFMALGYYLPFFIWESLSKSHSLNPGYVMKLISSKTKEGSYDLADSAKVIDSALKYHNRAPVSRSLLGRLRRRLGRVCLPRHQSGHFLAASFFLMKLLFVLNFFAQFALLNLFISTSFYMFGLHTLNKMWHRLDFWESEFFPRVIMCVFETRQLGENTHRQAIECTLPINLYNEKFFLLIWFWVCATGLLSLYSLLGWALSLRESERFRFIRDHLRQNENMAIMQMPSRNLKSSRPMIGFSHITLNGFVNDYLRLDGVLMLRIVKKNTNAIVVSELITQLWEMYAVSLEALGLGQPGPQNSQSDDFDASASEKPESSSLKAKEQI